MEEGHTSPLGQTELWDPTGDSWWRRGLGMCRPQMEPPRRTWVPGHWYEVSARPLGSVGSLASEEGGRRTAGEKSGAQLWPETLQVGLGAVGKEPKQQVLKMSQFTTGLSIQLQAHIGAWQTPHWKGKGQAIGGPKAAGRGRGRRETARTAMHTGWTHVAWYLLLSVCLAM